MDNHNDNINDFNTTFNTSWINHFSEIDRDSDANETSWVLNIQQNINDEYVFSGFCLDTEI